LAAISFFFTGAAGNGLGVAFFILNYNLADHLSDRKILQYLPHESPDPSGLLHNLLVSKRRNHFRHQNNLCHLLLQLHHEIVVVPLIALHFGKGV
jgi:hypothetical protein